MTSSSETAPTPALKRSAADNSNPLLDPGVLQQVLSLGTLCLWHQSANGEKTYMRLKASTWHP
jgi:hypothetical protein